MSELRHERRSGGEYEEQSSQEPLLVEQVEHPLGKPEQTEADPDPLQPGTYPPEHVLCHGGTACGERGQAGSETARPVVVDQAKRHRSRQLSVLAVATQSFKPLSVRWRRQIRRFTGMTIAMTTAITTR
jgi:hypothetical protein